MPFFAPGAWQGVNQSAAIDRQRGIDQQLAAERKQLMDMRGYEMEMGRAEQARQQQMRQADANLWKAPQPPMPGQASVPMQPPGQGQPPPMAPPPGMQNMPQQGQLQGGAQPMPGQSGGVPPYRTLQGAGQPPQGQAPQGQPMAPPPVQSQQPQGQRGGFSLESVIDGMRKQGIPEEYWSDLIKQRLPLIQESDRQRAADLADRKLVAMEAQKPPSMRTVVKGDKEIQEEWNPATRSWTQIGGGPRFARQVVGGGAGAGGGTGSASGAGMGIVAGDLDTVPKKDRATVKAISEGRQKISDVGYRGADRMRLVAMVNAFNPEFNPQGNASIQPARTQLIKDLAAIRPFKEMLDTNINVAIELGKKVMQSDSKYANKSINWIKQNVGDNPDTAEYLAQIAFVQTEAARVLNNPRLVGQLTDSARHEMQQVVDGSMPINSTERVLKRIQQDGQNRVAAMVKEKNMLDKDISGGKGDSGPKKISSDADYAALPSGTEFIAPDGSHRKKP